MSADRRWAPRLREGEVEALNEISVELHATANALRNWGRTGWASDVDGVAYAIKADLGWHGDSERRFVVDQTEEGLHIVLDLARQPAAVVAPCATSEQAERVAVMLNCEFGHAAGTS